MSNRKDAKAEKEIFNNSKIAVKITVVLLLIIAFMVIIYEAVFPNLGYMISHGQVFPALLVISATFIICLVVTLLLKPVFKRLF